MKKEVPTGYYFSPLYRANQDFEIISAASALLSEKKAHKIILTGQLSSDIYCWTLQGLFSQTDQNTFS